MTSRECKKKPSRFRHWTRMDGPDSAPASAEPDRLFTVGILCGPYVPVTGHDDSLELHCRRHHRAKTTVRRSSTKTVGRPAACHSRPISSGKQPPSVDVRRECCRRTTGNGSERERRLPERGGGRQRSGRSAATATLTYGRRLGFIYRRPRYRYYFYVPYTG